MGIYLILVSVGWELSYYDYYWKFYCPCNVAGGMQRSGSENKKRLGQEINYRKFFFCWSDGPLVYHNCQS